MNREILIENTNIQEGDIVKLKNNINYVIFDSYYSGDNSFQYAYFKEYGGICLKDFNKFFKTEKNKIYVKR